LRIFGGPDFLGYYRVLKCALGKDGEIIQNFKFWEMGQEHVGTSLKVGNLGVRFQEGRHCFGSVPTYQVAFITPPGEGIEDDAVLYITADSDRAANISDSILEKDRFLCFHDMGWTGLPPTEERVHPTEKEVYAKFGDNPKIVGIHTSKPLRYYHMAQKGEIFYV
jgi:hypothetical protein